MGGLWLFGYGTLSCALILSIYLLLLKLIQFVRDAVVVLLFYIPFFYKEPFLCSVFLVATGRRTEYPICPAVIKI